MHERRQVLATEFQEFSMYPEMNLGKLEELQKSSRSLAVANIN